MKLKVSNMKLSKAARRSLIAFFTLTAVFVSVAFSLTSSAKSFADFSQNILSGTTLSASAASEAVSAQKSSTKLNFQSALPKNSPPPQSAADDDGDKDRDGRNKKDDDGEDDADVPRFMIGKISKEDYLSRRDEHINRLRGIEKGKPFDAGRRSRAVRQLDRQEGLPDKNTLTIRTNGANKGTEVSSGGVIGTLAPMLGLSSQANSVWTSVGPAPIPNGQTFSVAQAVSGRVTAIAIHPTNNDIAYVGTAQGGVYRTLDGGASWTPLFDNAQTLAVGSIAIAPSQPSTIYVGTGEGNFSCDTYFGVGIYRIDNADGSTPVLTGPFNQETGTGTDVLTGRSISKVLVHPTDPNTIFIAANSGGIAGVGCSASASPASRGLFRSTNATSSNATFQKLTTNTVNGGNRSVTDVEFEPGNPNTMLATVVGFNTAGDGGVYRSTNALDANPVFTQTLVIGSATATARAELAINKVGNAVTVFAAISDSSGTLKRSLDGGITWSAALANATGFCSTQCTYDMPIAIDQSNANIVYIGGNADGTSSAIIKKSINGLAAAPTFAKVQNGLHADSHVIEVAPSDNNTIFFGSDGGVWKSTNAANSWTSLNNTGFNATQFVSLALHPTDPNYMIGGTQDNGTERMKPDGTWTRTDFGDGGFALIDQSATNTTTVRQYHTYFNQVGTGGLVAFATSTSSSAFENWTALGCGGTANGLSCTDSAVAFYAPMALGPGSPNTLYFGTDRLYRSSNSGTTMTVVAPQFVSGIYVSAIGISSQNDAVRIVGLKNGKVYRTMTGGATSAAMTDVTGTIPAAYVSRAVIDPNNVNTAYVTLSGFFGNATPHIYKTTNLNAAAPTWTGIGTNIPDVPVNAFVVDPSDSNMVYAGTDIGVYRSTDGGTTWTAFSSGLPRVAVFDMAIQNVTHTLRIATHGRGMWEMSIAASPAIIEGTVTNSSTSEPIANATVKAGANTTTTDINGFYRFSSVPAATYSMTVSAVGYATSSPVNVTAANGSTVTNNFSLAQTIDSNCAIDTTQSDFEAGQLSNADTMISSGDVKLAVPPSVNEEQTGLSAFSNSFTATTWQSQTFTPSITGRLNKVDFQAALTSAASVAGTVVVEIRNTASGVPGSTVLATKNLTSINSTGNLWYSVTFDTPVNVTAGTLYAIVLRAGTGGPYRGVYVSSNAYPGGAWLQSSNSGASWATLTSGGVTLDLAFRAYVSPPQDYFASGYLISSLKDANMADGTAAAWTTLSWTASTPVGTDVKFQVAGSNNAGGLFNFVGPDGTANTYFTNGDSLSQFNGSRYLKYKAYLSTTDTSATPTLNDVTVCNSNAPLPAANLVVSPASGTYGGTTTLSATLTSSDGNPLSGRIITFQRDGSSFANNRVTTDANGVATFSNLSIAGINVGTYATAINARFGGDGSYGAVSGSGSLTVNPAVLTITADNKSRSYRAANPAFTYTPSGFVGSDTASVLSGVPAFDTTADVDSNVGNYPINASAGDLSATNYSFTFVAGTLSVTKATPTINWSNPADITYGTALDGTQLNAAAVNPNDGSTVAGSFSYNPAAGSVPTAGTKTLSVNFTPESSLNYDAPQQKTVSLNVLKKTLTITADDKEKVFGTSNPTLTYTASGFANGDTQATAFTGTPQLTTTATTYSQVGNYPIDAAVGSLASANYSFSFVSGTLKVTKAVLTIKADNKSKLYGGALPTFSYTPSGFVGGDTASVLSGAPAFNTTATNASGVGNYPITVSAGTLTAANYSFNFVGGLLSVTPASLTIMAENKTKQYSDQMPAFTATYSGFVLNQTPTNLTGSLGFTTSAGTLSPAGSYPIVPAGQSSLNYAITYQNGTLVVTQEDAFLTYTGDSLVSTSKGSGTVNLAALVTEAQDGSLGNSLSGKTVKFLIFKSNNMTMTTADYTVTGVIGSNNTATASLSLSADNYSIRLQLADNNQYAADVEDAVLTVVDPGTGMTTGGGWVNDANGSRVHFGFTMKYVPSGNPKGNNIVSYHDNLDLSAYGAPAGIRAYNLIAKSNAMSAMLINSTTTPKTSTFTGKNNLWAVDRVTGISYNIGGGLGLQFEVDATDTDNTSNSTNPDLYALRLWNTTGNYKVVGTYASSGANTSQIALGGGNIQVK